MFQKFFQTNIHRDGSMGAVLLDISVQLTVRYSDGRKKMCHIVMVVFFWVFIRFRLFFLENIIQPMNILLIWYGGQKFLPYQKFLRFDKNCHFQKGPHMHPWQRKSEYLNFQPSGAVKDHKIVRKHSRDNFWRKNIFDIFFLYRNISKSISPNFGKIA